ncbi:hypothetical protein [Pontibacillus sp. HMF3514]|uniref:hypothetical protein n=1 Tax=Pontibacillus sp. HMF3514 TaxID=2692425 RepID=UPI00131FA0AA|nr:hypothetical protein [Pontibacillus sp. HMF3514]QHE52650.1 hypothetical protein GS400_11680 [Pontibacillus sp. HMF3514]
MNSLRFVDVFVLGICSYLAYEKGLELNAIGTNVDGEGIGISFIGLPVADRVPESNIPQYTKGFVVFSISLGIVSLFLLFLPFIKKLIPSIKNQ